MAEPPLFSKNLDDLLPPEPKLAKNPRSPRIERGETDPPQPPAMAWWQTGLVGGIVVFGITLFRLFASGIRNGFDDIDWDEFGVIAAATFAGGFVFGLLLWALQWLKWRSARSRV